MTEARPSPIVKTCTATIDRERLGVLEEVAPANPSLKTAVEPAPLKVQYIVVRADLPHGVQVAQTAHAAGEAAGHPPTIVVALSVPDEHTLRRIAEALGENSLTYKLITEDAGPFAGQAMALGVSPSMDRKAIGKVTSALPLVK